MSKECVRLMLPKLGELRYAEGIWEGRLPSTDLEIAIAGDELGPEKGQLQALLSWLERLREIEQQIQAFTGRELHSVPEVKAGNFQIQSLNLLWPNEKDYFMVFLRLEGDEQGLWKVEFVGGEPKYLSRDD